MSLQYKDKDTDKYKDSSLHFWCLVTLCGVFTIMFHPMIYNERPCNLSAQVFISIDPKLI